jgi:hypothetical protein
MRGCSPRTKRKPAAESRSKAKLVAAANPALRASGLIFANGFE